MFYVKASGEMKGWTIPRLGLYFNFISELADEQKHIHTDHTVAEVTPRHI
jgi:hypothetical protein